MPLNSVYELIEQEFGPGVDTDSFEADIALQTSFFTVVVPEPKRCILWITNNSGNSVAISILNTVTMTTGRIIAPGETLDLRWYKDFHQVARGWFGIAAASTGTIHVREVRLI